MPSLPDPQTPMPRPRVPATPDQGATAPRLFSSRPAAEASRIDLVTLEPAVGLDTAVVLVTGTILGSVLAVIVLPSLLPDLTASLLGGQPKAFWYLSRSAGVVGYLALWLSMVLGLSLTNRFARLWAGGPAVADVHQFSALLALVLIAFHIIVLLGDPYIGYRLEELLVPFASMPYEPFWVGLGQVAAYLALPVAFSFYVRRAIGVRAWRLIHYGSFGSFVLAAAHGLGAGTDAQYPAMLGMFLVTVGSVLFLTVYRMLTSVVGRSGARRVTPTPERVRTGDQAGVYSLQERPRPERSDQTMPGRLGRQASS